MKLSARYCFPVIFMLLNLFQYGNASCYPDWMSFNYELFKNKPLYDLFLPGTHNSHMSYISDYTQYSYDQNDTSQVSLVQRLQSLSTLPDFQSFVFGWTVNQDMNISTQFFCGIRLLDIKLGRLVTKPEDPNIYTVHLFPGPLFSSVLQEIKEYVAHSEELIYIRLQSFYGFTSEDHQAVLKMLTASLGNKMAFKSKIPDLKSATYESLMKSNQKIVVFYDNVQVSSTSDHLFPFQDLWMKWPNAQNLTQLEMIEDDIISKYSPPQLRGLQWILTPGVEIIVRSLFFSSPANLRDYQNETNHALEAFLQRHQNDSIQAAMVDFPTDSGIILLSILRSGGKVPNSVDISSLFPQMSSTIGFSSTAAPDVPSSETRLRVHVSLFLAFTLCA
eukprot:Sdes_comp12189_c0_seq1m2945